MTKSQSPLTDALCDKMLVEKDSDRIMVAKLTFHAQGLEKRLAAENAAYCACTEVLQEAQHPRIFTRCPSCHNDTLTINKGHLLCTWHECKDPTMIDRMGENS